MARQLLGSCSTAIYSRRRGERKFGKDWNEVVGAPSYSSWAERVSSRPQAPFLHGDETFGRGEMRDAAAKLHGEGFTSGNKEHVCTSEVHQPLEGLVGGFHGSNRACVAFSLLF